MTGVTIHDAAATTGWTPRMLRYVEELGLVVPQRSSSGYRLYDPSQLERLRSLRGLLERHGLDLGHVGFALRLRSDPALDGDLQGWLDGVRPARGNPADQPDQPADPTAGPDALAGREDWLAFEQDKHQTLLNP